MIKDVFTKIVNNKNKTFEKREELVSNVLLTNHCNQNCQFCFASLLMTKGKTKEMSLERYIKLLDVLRRNGSTKVFLMGGEPTLHTNFKKVVELTVKKGFDIDLFTNGQFSDDISKFLINMKSKIKMYHINIASPAYKIKTNRLKINNFINEVSRFSQVAIETTIGSLDKKILKTVFCYAKPILSKSYVRIGVDGALVTRGGFSLRKNKEIGKIILGLRRYLFKQQIKGLWLSEINPCMFKENEIEAMKKNQNINWKGYGCFSKNGGIDIKTDMKIIRCFGQDCLGGQVLKNNETLNEVKKVLDKKMLFMSKKTIPDECLSCSYYGHKKDNCPGPCLIGRT